MKKIMVKKIQSRKKMEKFRKNVHNNLVINKKEIEEKKK
jgi:hypothetical protein